MSAVKTAISLDAALLTKIDTLAAELELSRSRLLARAAAELLYRHETAQLVAELDLAYADGPTAEEVELRRAAKRRRRERLEGEW